MRVVCVSIGRSLYAVAVDRVVQVIDTPPITPLPTAPRSFAGLLNLRGEIVPMVSAADLLEGASSAVTPHVVVVGTAAGPVALPSLALPVAVEVDEPLGRSETPGCVAVFAVGDRLVTLVDVDELVEQARTPAGVHSSDR